MDLSLKVGMRSLMAVALLKVLNAMADLENFLV